jgi:hypothetical protein
MKFLLCPFFLFFVILTLTTSISAQVCGSGSIGVSGAGCGCLSGCNLSGIGGPNCGGGTSGDCTAGYVYMSITVNIPAGCSVLANADMQSRAGCSASGADGGNPPTCSTGDRMRVVSSANPSKPYQCGASNSTQTDSESLTVLVQLLSKDLQIEPMKSLLILCLTFRVALPVEHLVGHYL